MEKGTIGLSVESRRTPETLGNERTFGVILIKPDGMKNFSDVVIREYLDKFPRELTKLLKLPNEVAEKIPLLTVCKTVIVDLGDNSERTRKLIDTLYHREKDREFFPLLKDLYSDQVMILFISYPGTPKELKTIFKGIKGKETLVKPDGTIVREGTGFRGLLKKPQIFVSEEILDSLEFERYQEVLTEIINNIIHTTDHPEEAARIMELVLFEAEIEDMEQRGFRARNFINKFTKQTQNDEKPNTSF
ncbi:MAG: hypothetical protein ACOX50_00280 [Patescibacteria group bacterium]|jgi:hypothetical protein